MGSTVRPAAGDSPAAGRARPARPAQASDPPFWAVPGVTAAPESALTEEEPAGPATTDQDRAAQPRHGARAARRRRTRQRDSAGAAEQAGHAGRPDRQDGTGREGRTDRAAELDADPEEAARQICLRLLAASPKTRAQLAAALQRRGVPEQAAETVLERFADVQLIDDAMFAQAWVDSRHHGRGLARRALAAELRQRGVDSADIRVAVDRVDPEQEQATAQALVERRLPGTRGLPRQTRFRRLMGMLARKGYSEGLAYRVVRAALDSEESEAVLYLNRVAGLDATPAELMDADRFDLPPPEPDETPDGW